MYGENSICTKRTDHCIQFSLWNSWWKWDDCLLLSCAKERYEGDLYVFQCRLSKCTLSRDAEMEWKTHSCNFPYQSRKWQQQQQQSQSKGNKLKCWATFWVLNKTRAIANEIENYLCDLGPGINLFYFCFMFFFILVSVWLPSLKRFFHGIIWFCVVHPSNFGLNMCKRGKCALHSVWLIF